MKARLTYANVTATLALFVALGGTSYAVVQLPKNSVRRAELRKNSVGAAELRKKSVTSRAIRGRVVRLGDISNGAREALRGAAGPQGPAGPAGLTLRAAVPRGGTVARGNAINAAHQSGTNEYAVTFDRDVSQCVAGATLAAVAGNDVPAAGRVTLQQAGAQVVVRTFDAAGGPAEQPFNLVLAC